MPPLQIVMPKAAFRFLTLEPCLPILLALLSLITQPVVADDKLPRVAETFEIEGHKAYVYAAPESAKGKPWLTPQLGST